MPTTSPSTLYKEIDHSLVEHQIDYLHLQQRIFIAVTTEPYQSNTRGAALAEQLVLSTVPGLGLSPPSCRPTTSSGEGGQGSCGVPGGSSVTKSHLLFCIASTTQHTPLPVPKPRAIAPVRLGPSRWHQLDSELQH